ncbi:helix-turn-helix transcriptional regulator [Shinella sp. BYT-45]|uniref:helix-turn-helix transcriptional regulator n=1 Tax=Shinella sp. BYT-45 TaxID=3377377 RepID=UPI00398093FA
MRDERELRAIVSELSEEIRRATWGQTEWKDVCKAVTRSFPGSYAAILNQNVLNPGFGFVVSDGIEEEDFNNFLTHYSLRNPWQDFWSKSPSGAIIVSERDEPASLYRNSEFYNDWMRKVGDYDAAVGIKIRSLSEELLYLPTHYSTRLAETYDRELEYVMTRVRPVLDEAVSIKQRIRSLAEHQNALAALIDREEGIAFVIDETMRLKNANTAAIAEFERSKILRCQRDRIRFHDPVFNDRFRHSCRMLVGGAARSRHRLALRWRTGAAIVSLCRLPDVTIHGLLPVHPQILVQVTDPHQTASRPNLELLCAMYDLTPREALLCQSFAAGLPLQQACKAVGISYENGRQRLKMIFQKTGARNQAELRMILSRF